MPAQRADPWIGPLHGHPARGGTEPPRPVSVGQLAALGSMHVQAVRKLCASGEITRKRDGRISAAEARRWLTARGVRGVAPEVET